MATKNPERGRGSISPVNSVVLKQDSQRGRAADTLLKNKLWKTALSDMRNSALTLISDSSLDEMAKREDLYRFIKAIDKLESQLKIYFTKGKNAAIKLEDTFDGR